MKLLFVTHFVTGLAMPLKSAYVLLGQRMGTRDRFSLFQCLRNSYKSMRDDMPMFAQW